MAIDQWRDELAAPGAGGRRRQTVVYHRQHLQPRERQNFPGVERRAKYPFQPHLQPLDRWRPCLGQPPDLAADSVLEHAGRWPERPALLVGLEWKRVLVQSLPQCNKPKRFTSV